MPELYVKIEIADQALWDRTMEEYLAAFERDEITEADAMENLTALALGMLKVTDG